MPESDLFTQIGVGGIFAILIIREVFGFLKTKGSNGDGQTVLSHENKEAIKMLISRVQYKDSCDQIVKRIEGEFRNIERRDAERKEYQDEQFQQIDRQLESVKTLVKNGNR